MDQRPLIAGLAILLLAVGCASGATAGAAASPTSAAMSMSMPAATRNATTPARAPSTLVAPTEFAAAVARPGTVTIDVHIPFEGKLAGTDLMIPYNEIAQQASKLPANHATPLAIYCRTGTMSAIAAPALAALGYTDIVELRGGMQAWQASGRALLTAP